MIAQLSDPHLRLADDEPAGALEAAVATVLALAQPPDAVVLTGDLADTGDPREYALAQELLAPLPMPVHVIAGNHDDPAALRAAFPGPASTLAGGIRLILCDTTIPGSDAGRLDVAWIDDQLGDEAAPAVLAMHHPPFAIGLPAADAIAIAADDSRALSELLAGRPQVRRVICGHVHRTVVGLAGPCPVVALSSTNLQMRLDFAETEFRTRHEPPLIAVHALVEGEVVSHLQPVVR
jgi:3',5'-cyclic-AMP phosphodiesterase